MQTTIEIKSKSPQHVIESLHQIAGAILEVENTVARTEIATYDVMNELVLLRQSISEIIRLIEKENNVR